MFISKLSATKWPSLESPASTLHKQNVLSSVQKQSTDPNGRNACLILVASEISCHIISDLPVLWVYLSQLREIPTPPIPKSFMICHGNCVSLIACQINSCLNLVGMCMWTTTIWKNKLYCLSIRASSFPISIYSMS